MVNEAIHGLSLWLQATPLSAPIRNLLWIKPTLETTHILAGGLILSAAGMIDLRLLGVAGRRLTVVQTADRLLPWLWTGLAVIMASGLLLLLGATRRGVENPMFQIKMGLLLASVLLTAAFAAAVRGGAQTWETGGRRAVVGLLALASMLLWIATVFAGRWLAYADVFFVIPR